MTEDVGKIRIGCEVDSKEAKRGINDIYNSIGSLNKSINSMLNSGANTTLKAIGKVPSALKRLNNGISNVHNTANKMGNVIKKSYTELYSKIKLVTGAIKTFINTFKDLDSAYSKQVSAETRLSVAMSNSTGATRGQIQEIKDLTAEYQQLGIIGDEVQLTGLQELSTYVSSAESVKKLLPVLNDMTAQQYGFAASSENAFSIATALGKVLNGNTDTLKRYGYAFNDAQKQILKYGTEEQKVATLAEVVEASVGGMNNALANTPTGQITQLKNNFGDLKESLGELLTYVILPIAKYINVIIQRAIVGVKTLTEFIKSTFGIKTVAKDVNRITDGVSSVNNKNIDKTSDSLDDLGDSASKTKKKVNNLLGSFDELNILSDNSSDSTDNLADALNSIDSDSLDLGYGVSETIEVPDINDFRNKIAQLLESIDYSALGRKWGEGFNKILDKWNPITVAERLASTLNNIISTINNFLTTADFNKFGKKIGTLVNKFVQKFDSKALGNIISNGINGAIAFANGALTETDFKALGESIGNYIMGIFGNLDYEGIGDALINALSAAVDTASGILSKIDFSDIGKGIAKAGNRLTKNKTVWANLARTISKALTGVLDLVIGFMQEFSWEDFGGVLATTLAELDWSSILSKVGIAIWEGFKAVLQITWGSIKKGLFYYYDKLEEWKKTLGDIKALTKDQEDFINSVDTSNEKINDIKTSISESSKKADEAAKNFEDLYKKLGDCVDEYGNIKRGSEEYADELINELNGAYGTNLQNIDGQIKGYKELCDNIDKYIAKIKAQAIATATESEYATAISEHSKASKDIAKAQTEYEQNINDLEGLANSIQNAYFDIFNEVLDFGDLNTDSALEKIEKAMEEIGYALADDPLLNKNMLDFKENKLDKYTQSEETIAATTKMVEGEFRKIAPIAKKYGLELQNIKDKNYGQSVTELAYALHNNANEFLRVKDVAKSTLETTKQQIEGHEKLVDVLNDENASATTLNNVMTAYTNGVTFSKGKENIDEITKKYKEWQTEHANLVKEYESGYLKKWAVEESEKVGQAWERQLALAKANLAEGAKTWTVDATKALLSTKDFASEGEYLAWYSKLFGVEYIPDAISSLVSITGMSPDDIIKQYLKTYPEGTSENNVKQIVNKLYPDATKEEIANKVKTYMNYGRAQALKRYFDEHPNMSESDKKAFLKSIMPDGTSDDTVNKLYKVITDTVDSAVFKAEKHFDGGMFSTEGALGAALTPTAKNALKAAKSENKFVNIGSSMAAGVEEGLKSGIPNIQKASSNIIDESDKAMRKEGDIHSPSKLTKLTGIALSEGVAVGIKEGLNKILDAVKYVCNKTVDAFKITGMNANILKTYAYSYVSNFFNGIALKGYELVNIKNITDKVVSSFKLTLWNSGMLTKYGNAYVADYIKGVVLTDAHKKNISNIQNIVIVLLKPSVNTLNNAKIYGESIVQSMISGMTVSSANKTTISNAGTTVYNSMINSMNNLSGSLSTSSNNFIHNLTNPITNGLSALLSSMDSFYIKFRNKWQGVANLLSNKFIGNSMGITKVPNLNDNYYPFGDNIVRLAQGAVIKPNNEFMAILGDQKRGVNIETPLATMKQAFIEALNDGGYNGGNITIPVYIGNEKIDTLIVNSNNRRSMRNNGRV